MATTVDLNRFDDGFKKHPNFTDIVKQINQSPTLVAAINNFQGEIQQGKSNSGGFFQPNVDPRKTYINIDKDWIDQTIGDPTFQGEFITMLGHEIGHAVMPNGHGEPSPPINPQESMQNGLNNEGVALTTEYKIATELNVSMWSDANGSVKAAYDQLASQHPIGSAEFDEKGMALGAQTYAAFQPSIAQNLNYEQYYLSAAVIDMCGNSPGDFSTVDWQAAKPNDITYTTNKDGTCTYTGSLPTLSGTAGSLSGPVNINVNFPASNVQEKSLSQALSPEIQALHDKIGGFLYPTLEKSNVSQKHADSMVATAVQQAVDKNISADEVMHAGVDKTKNLIGVFTKEVYKVAAFDAVEASKNDPEKTLAAAQQQLEQQPIQEQQRQQQMEQQTKERSAPSMGM